jgi:hypothetical protein
MKVKAKRNQKSAVGILVFSALSFNAYTPQSINMMPMMI